MNDAPDRAVHVLIFDGFADWEPAHAVAELRRHGRYRVEFIGLTPEPVVSMGGMTVVPSRILSNVDPADVAVFIMPGGDRWERVTLEPEIVNLIQRLSTADVPIAAICAATVAVARAGLVRGRRHTSNGLDYLRALVPEYNDADRYVDAPAVRDRKLITASGLADVEFAREIFEELNVMSAEERALWAQIFRTATLPAEPAAERE